MDGNTRAFRYVALGEARDVIQTAMSTLDGADRLPETNSILLNLAYVEGVLIVVMRDHIELGDDDAEPLPF